MDTWTWPEYEVRAHVRASSPILGKNVRLGVIVVGRILRRENRKSLGYLFMNLYFLLNAKSSDIAVAVFFLRYFIFPFWRCICFFFLLKNSKRKMCPIQRYTVCDAQRSISQKRISCEATIRKEMHLHRCYLLSTHTANRLLFFCVVFRIKND